TIAIILERDYDEEGRKENCGPTLLLCPVIIMKQWIKEFQRCSKIPLNICIYHSNFKKKVIESLEQDECDIVITSVETVQREYSKDGMRAPLHKIHWRRIVIDEAHKIKNRKSKSANAVY